MRSAPDSGSRWSESMLLGTFRLHVPHQSGRSIPEDEPVTVKFDSGRVARMD